MFLSTSSITIISLGTLYLLFIAYSSRKLGLLNLHTAGIGTIWIGYFLSPALSLIDNRYISNMLVTEYIVEILIYALCCMVSISFGWKLYRNKTYIKIENRNETRLNVYFDRFKPYYSLLLICLIIVTFFGMFFKIQGVENFWVSSIPRGFGQHDVATQSSKIHKMFIVVYNIIPVLTILFSSIFLVTRQKNKQVFLFSLVGLVVGSLPYMHGLSRASGIAFVFLTICGLMVSGKRFLFKGVVLIYLAFIFSQVGLVSRANYPPGIGSFFNGVTDYVYIDKKDNTTTGYINGYASFNPLDQIPPTSQLFQAREEYKQSLPAAIVGFISQINPLPAAFIPLKPFGLSSLSERLGTIGSSGITVPVLGQSYNAMGYVGVFIWVLVGWLLAWVQYVHIKFKTVLTTVALLFVIAGLVSGLHSQLRAMLRPIHLSILLCWIEAYRINFKR